MSDPPKNDLPSRSRKILLAAVTEFISTGIPVGSRTLARRYGLDLSAASIRNVLADLEEAGYLHQPHTSAGRIPTDRALRVLIDTLLEVRAIPPQQAEMGARFHEIYTSASDPLRETGRYLSELAGTAAVIAAPSTAVRALSTLRFITTRQNQLLAVLVFADGSVENRFISIDGPIPEAELLRIHNLLSDVIGGRTLGEVRDLFASRLADERHELDALRRRAFELGHLATADMCRRGEVVIEGQNRLLDLPEYADVDRLKMLMKALEEREEILDLLDRTLAAGTGAIAVYVGSEAGMGGGQLSVVAAPYTENGRFAGTVGVIGPTRMDYAKVMPLVDATAAAVSEARARLR
ncbi:heat-inducible transcriptional repressor HrcA [Chondromyces apiculatus]|uniref:Heat-inducible transcription repressor HrcA n=1 Tax=Chondromyces apiculatus DSM 436 TaxID=1192034 RepID=A0A017T8N1_9BACT|nr:heat-inducible transcriptional repressor HrcA [Chondromyces apiculatus]EYF05574.1 Heat-inducible transcription repressor HrcA [Chondromyces apiculatus DSM 436]